MRVLDSGCAMRDDQGMADQWFIRVEGKEYGPADLAMLREWKGEGRVLATNDARKVDVDLWMTAAQIPGLFASSTPPVQVEKPIDHGEPPKPVSSFVHILGQTLRIYFRGLMQYLCLTLLIIAPSLCAQFAEPIINTAPHIDAELRQLVSWAFAFCMSVLVLVLWPIYVAGIQILTAQLAGGDRISFLKVLNAAASFWPRVAFLCLYVALCFIFWTVLPIGIAFSLLVGVPTVWSIFAALLLLAFQVWMVSRLFVNFMFWQQFAVLEDCNIADSLVRSRALARGRQDLPWYRRPLWRGAVIASLWCAIVLALNWPALQSYLQTMMTTSDLQALVDKLRAMSQTPPAPGAFWIGLAQAALRPLLGIGFVLLYFDSKIDM
jgi:hypothetical protein